MQPVFYKLEGFDVLGLACTARTDAGHLVSIWIPAPWLKDPQTHFCHGLSFGTYSLLGYSVFGESIPTLLEDEYREVDFTGADEVAVNDVIVFSRGNCVVHSAVFNLVYYDRLQGTSVPGLINQQVTTLHSKNGFDPTITVSLYREILKWPNTTYKVYRKKT